jgi:hypothetical protein
MGSSRAHGRYGEPIYMGLGFKLISGPTDLELKHFDKGDGTSIPYHTVRSYGPYAQRGPASAAVKEYRDYEEAGNKNFSYAIVKSTGWEFDPPKKKR